MIYELDWFSDPQEKKILLLCLFGLQRNENKKKWSWIHTTNKRSEERFPIFMTQQWHQTRKIFHLSQRFVVRNFFFDLKFQFNEVKSNKNFLCLSWPFTNQKFVFLIYLTFFLFSFSSNVAFECLRIRSSFIWFVSFKCFTMINYVI